LRTHYNRIAGQNLDRLAALSDGVFAIAMTLLVLDLRVPANHIMQGQQHYLLSELLKMAPNILTYFMSFLTLGIFWVGQQTQLNYFARSDRHLSWIHLGYLLAVTLVPFSTALLSAFVTSRTALVIYWFNIFLMGLMLYVSIRYAKHAKIMNDMMVLEMHSAHERRIISAQMLYAFGALLCIINTYVSIVVIVFIQLVYVTAPRIRWFDRLFG
jgi:uncharacterized membrane protein